MKIIIYSLFVFLISFESLAQGDIYLSTPTDGEVIEEKTLNFVWQVASLSSQDNPRLSQELIVTQMKNDQTSYEAIEINSPLIIKSNILGTSYFINNSSFPFEAGKKYAWQIRYYLNNVAISKSEVWWFEIAQPKLKYEGFIPLRQKYDGQILKLDSKQLNVSLISKGDLDLNITIVSSDGKKITTKFKEVISQELIERDVSVSGNNNRTFTLDLKELKIKKGNYKLEWKPKKTESYVLNFELK